MPKLLLSALLVLLMFGGVWLLTFHRQSSHAARDAPTNLSVEHRPTVNHLRWNGVRNANRYEIQVRSRTNNSDWTDWSFLDSPVVVNYFHVSIDADTAYQYRVGVRFAHNTPVENWTYADTASPP